MRLFAIIFLCAFCLSAQNITHSKPPKPLSCHLAEGSRTLLQGSVITGSVVLSYINAILPVIAEIVVAAIMRKIIPNSPGEDNPGTAVTVNKKLAIAASDLLHWYDRIGLGLFASYARTSSPSVSEVFHTAFEATARDTASSSPSVTTILTLGSAVLAVLAAGAYPMLNGWCEHERG